MTDVWVKSRDRDSMVRTMLTEAASNDPLGWAAVGSVIRNRMAKGGLTPHEVVTAPNQFEVWTNGRAQSVDPRSPEYEAAGRVADAIAAGVPDPTGGATHFFSPAGQRAYGRNDPAWGRGEPLAKMGGHLFFAPEGKVTFSGSAPAAIADATNGKQQPVASKRNWGLDDDEPASPPAKTKQAAPAAKRNWGLDDDTPANSPAIKPNTPANTPANSVPSDDYAKGGDAAAAVGRGIIEGVPIAGPYLLGGVERGAAAVRSLTNNTPFQDELSKVRQFSGATAEAHPYATIAGNVGGSVAGMAPAIAAAPAAFGMGAGGIVSRMGMGGLSGAAIGGMDATARGENPLAGIGFGALGGVAGPPAGEVLAAGANSAVQGLRRMMPTGVPGMGRGTANMLTQVIGADDPAAIKSFLSQHGPMAMIADAGPSSLGLTQALATKPGEAKTTVVNALTSRANGSNERIANQLTQSLGPAEDPQLVTKGIRELRSTNDAAYKTVHAGAPEVDPSSVVGLIDRQIETATGAQKTALQKIRGELVEKAATATEPAVLTTNSEKLHNLRKDLDSVINYGTPGLGVEAGAVSKNQGSLKAVRGELDDVLKSQVPGMAEADASSAMLAKRMSAVERGHDDILGARAPHPDTFAAERAAMSPGEAIAENKGIRGRVDRMFGSGTQRDAVTLNKLLAGGEDGYAAANLATAFGKPEANALLDTLAREKAFQSTKEAVVNNSMTAQRQAGSKMLEASEPGSLNLTGMNAAGLALQGVKSAVVNPLIKAVMESPNASRQLELARVMTAQGATRDQILNALMRIGNVNALQAATMASIAKGGNLLTMGAGSRYRPNELLVGQ